MFLYCQRTLAICCVLIRYLYVVQKETWCYNLGEEWISIIKSCRQEEHPVNGNKQNCNIARCRLTSGNRATLPKCSKEGIVFFGLRSCDVKRLWGWGSILTSRFCIHSMIHSFPYENVLEMTSFCIIFSRSKGSVINWLTRLLEFMFYVSECVINTVLVVQYWSLNVFLSVLPCSRVQR